MDRAGILGSILCLVHCLAFPLIASVFSIRTASHEEPEGLHTLLVLLLLPIAVVAFSRGWARHRRASIALLGLVGVALITLAGPGREHLGEASMALIEEFETSLTILGSSLLIAGHLLNIRVATARRSWLRQPA